MTSARDASTGGAVARSREFMEMAKDNLRKDKVVATIVFLFREGDEPMPILAEYGNDEQKRHFFDEALPSPVEAEQADGVLVVAEAWMNGQDAIVVFAEERDGSTATWVTPFTKKFPRRVTLGETDGGDGGDLHLFTAVRELWASR